MAKPNALLRLLDGTDPLTAANVPDAIGGVPFIRHQFNWFLEKVASEPPMVAAKTFVGYTGIKKLTPARDARLAEMVKIIQAIPPAQLATLPLPAHAP
jgi:hypothetical protein